MRPVKAQARTDSISELSLTGEFPRQFEASDSDLRLRGNGAEVDPEQLSLEL